MARVMKKSVHGKRRQKAKSKPLEKTADWQREGCISAWSPHYNKDKQLLERIQHRFTRILLGMKELSYK